MTTSYNNILQTTIGAAACTAAVCAFAGKFTKSPTLHKVQDIATSIAIVGTACYAYLNIGNTPKPNLGRYEGRNQCRVVEAAMNQFHVLNGQAACTTLATSAEVKMLKGELQTSKEIMELLYEGAKKHKTICATLRSEGFLEKQVEMLSFDQCYLSGSLQKELSTGRDIQTDLPKEIPILLSNPNPFLRALKSLARAAGTTPQGAILTIEPSTYAISISAPLQNGRQTIQFFDSHGSHDFDRDNTRKTPAGALLATFPSVEELANYLQWKSQHSTHCGLYHCWLPAPKADSPHLYRS